MPIIVVLTLFAMYQYSFSYKLDHITNNSNPPNDNKVLFKEYLHVSCFKYPIINPSNSSEETSIPSKIVQIIEYERLAIKRI